MRIDDRNFPALFDNDLVIRPYKHNAPQEMIDMFYDIIKTAKQNLYFTASTIMDHVSHSFEKLMPLRDGLPDVCRGLLFKMGPDRPHCFFYLITNHPDRVNIMGQVSALEDGKHFGQIIAGYYLKNSDKLEFHAYEAVKGIDGVTTEAVKIILANELFINYAEVEKKELQPNRQIWDGPRAIYNNKSKSPITIIDSTWYTHLVSSGAFNVRGHFRLQPYGYGLKDRKLIWIDDFQKDGYTRKAKIEKLD